MTSEVREKEQQQIEWRRSQVLELASQGYNQREICQKLQLDKSAVSRDMAHLRQQAQDNLQKHIHEVVPEEYQKCIAGIKHNLKETIEIANTVSDPRVKLQARAIVNECYRYIMDLCTNAGIISDAIDFVEKKNAQLNKIKKLEKEKEELGKQEKEEEEEESAGVF